MVEQCGKKKERKFLCCAQVEFLKILIGRLENKKCLFFVCFCFVLFFFLFRFLSLLFFRLLSLFVQVLCLFVCVFLIVKKNPLLRTHFVCFFHHSEYKLGVFPNNSFFLDLDQGLSLRATHFFPNNMLYTKCSLDLYPGTGKKNSVETDLVTTLNK